MTLLEKILKILDGIDKTEVETLPNCNGWWETSTGAEFGAKKIAEIKSLFNDKKQSLNIYKIEWVQGGAFGLSAVVIAQTEEEALKELYFGNDDSETEIFLIGICTDGTDTPCVVCQESL